MESSSLVKIAAAFVIGVVVALGSALLYVRTNEVPEKPSNVAPLTPEENQSPEPDTPPAPKTETNTPVKEQPKALPKRAAVRPKPVRPVKKPEREPITVIAQTYPATGVPPSSVPAKTPTPAVNEPAPLPPMPNPAPTESDVPVLPAVQQPHIVTLQAGTNLQIRLGETLASDHNYTGDTFRATLENQIIVDGFIIADRGSKVLGKVVNAQQAGRIEGLSGLTLALTEINTTDGQRVRIETDLYDKRGPSSVGSDAAKIAGGAALGAIIGAIAGGGKGAAIGASAGGAAGTGIVLATRGRPTTLPTETRLAFRLAAPVTITEQINN
ncbi:MAG: hypothetical protein JOZ45_09580 [Acidobacteriaceae bacterium]|nr:hypothetical protein [Acidobacteriaceae bacterium]